MEPTHTLNPIPVRRLALAFVLAVLTATNAIAQIFCVSGKEFNYPSIAQRMQLQASFLARYDVVDFAASNFRIQSIDTTRADYVGIFKESIIINLKQLTYLKDSLNFELIVRFRIRPAQLLSTDYIEAPGDNEIHFVTRAVVPVDNGIYEYLPLPPNPDLDSVIIREVVQYKSGPVHKSEILVERLFDTEEGATIIIQNNYPDLLDEIMAISSRCPKDRFLRYGPNANRYFIKFSVERDLKGCGKKETY